MSKVLFFMALALCFGCQTPEPYSTTFQTASPDIWKADPSQSVSIKVEFRR